MASLNITTPAPEGGLSMPGVAGGRVSYATQTSSIFLSFVPPLPEGITSPLAWARSAGWAATSLLTQPADHRCAAADPDGMPLSG